MLNQLPREGIGVKWKERFPLASTHALPTPPAQPSSTSFSKKCLFKRVSMGHLRAWRCSASTPASQTQSSRICATGSPPPSTPMRSSLPSACRSCTLSCGRFVIFPSSRLTAATSCGATKSKGRALRLRAPRSCRGCLRTPRCPSSSLVPFSPTPCTL